MNESRSNDGGEVVQLPIPDTAWARVGDEAVAAQAEVRRLHQLLAKERERVNHLLCDLSNAETDLVAKRNEIQRLKAELNKVTNPPKLGDADEVFAYWRRTCRGDNPRVVFGPKRREKVTARLREGYSVAELKQAVDGAYTHPFVNEHGKVFDELELICRDEVKADDFMARGDPAGLLEYLRAFCQPIIMGATILSFCPICADGDSVRTLEVDLSSRAVMCVRCWSDAKLVLAALHDRQRP